MLDEAADPQMCEICNNLISKVTSPKFWWEKVEEPLDPNVNQFEYAEIKSICQECGEELKHTEKKTQLDGFHKRYWSILSSIFNYDNLLLLISTATIAIVGLLVAILVFGFWYPSDIGY